ncbi:MAG: VOC family protein [Aggregatilineales bacterium]
MQPAQKLNLIETRTASLHPATDVGTVTLKVADLQRSLKFYTELIGLQPFPANEHAVVLGAGQRAILTLEAVPGADRQPVNTTGLYHAAILLPARHALAVKMAQIASVQYPFGYSDHLVSEAFYLSDPDGNGLELYRDRPRSEWHWDGQQVRMASDPIDFDSFFAEIKDNDEAIGNPAVPDGTKLGHMHLRVANIPLAEQFYQGVLGFDVTAKWPGALFLAAGGYHHHLGMNTWESRNGKPPVEPSVGLREFSISLPDMAELDRLTKQIEAAGVTIERSDDSAVLHDPWQNRIKLVLQGQLVR